MSNSQQEINDAVMRIRRAVGRLGVENPALKRVAGLYAMLIRTPGDPALLGMILGELDGLEAEPTTPLEGK